ncbi:hypothetical protein SAMN06295974_3828 [Plantibacter flavus]|uniref:Uncharacterized protein n=1 Tax=Plantibacter flavus TaxID=150123 RepID=A0A3N2BL85_9MICO|nr:hypothetical protein EDD42_3978 [Plantibacter flavus]SMG49217.1 hypothetical protein SAMN06295974_3828 [Plantibacter flavus]
MSRSEPAGSVEIAHLCTQFLANDRDAQGWAFLYPNEESWESPDCDEMSERFLRFARELGFDGVLVRAESAAEGEHWFTVVQPAHAGEPVAIDWTARQFHNAGHPAPPTDPLLIPCPLVFPWPSDYPLDIVDFKRMGQASTPARQS